MKKKYEFTGEVMDYSGTKLRRIRRISDGLLGGWIEKEENLSHEDSCFVYDSAKVWGDAEISNNAEVCGNAEVYGSAKIFDNACVSGNTRVSGDAKLSGWADVYGNAWVYGYAQVFDNGHVYGKARVYGEAHVSGEAWVCGDAKVHGSAIIDGRTDLRGDVVVSKPPLVLSGLDYPIVKTDHHILIGCQVFPLSKIPKRITDAWLRKHVVDSHHIEWYKKHKAAIDFILQHKQK